MSLIKKIVSYFDLGIRKKRIIQPDDFPGITIEYDNSSNIKEGIEINIYDKKKKSNKQEKIINGLLLFFSILPGTAISFLWKFYYKISDFNIFSLILAVVITIIIYPTVYMSLFKIMKIRKINIFLTFCVGFSWGFLGGILFDYKNILRIIDILLN